MAQMPLSDVVREGVHHPMRMAMPAGAVGVVVAMVMARTVGMRGVVHASALSMPSA